MLEYYVDSEFKLRQLRGCPVGKYMDCFADWLHAARYKRRPAQLLLRSAAHLGHWASIRKVRIDQLDSPGLDTFARHIATCTCTHAFHGRGHYNEEGAKRFVEHLQTKLKAEYAPSLDSSLLAHLIVFLDCLPPFPFSWSSVNAHCFVE